MKKIYSHIILPGFLLFSGVAHAEVGHYFSVDVYGGEWSIWEPRLAANNLSLGAAGAAGAAYELQAGKPRGNTFFLLHIGVSAQAGMSFFNTQYQNVDPKTIAVVSRSDRYNALAVQVPFLMGVQHKRFYMLAGMKIGYNAVETFWSSAKLTKLPKDTTIHRDLRMDSINPIRLDACLEVGMQIGNKEVYSSKSSVHAQYRLALFVDFGLTGYNKWHSKPKAFNPDNLQLLDIMSCGEFVPSESRYSEKNPGGIKDGEYLGRNILAGIKFTVLFPTGRARYRYTRVNRFY